MINPSAEEAIESRIAVRGAKARSGEGQVLTADDIHAHNTFEQPRALESRPTEVQIKDGEIFHRFPRASATCLEIDLV